MKKVLIALAFVMSGLVQAEERFSFADYNDCSAAKAEISRKYAQFTDWTSGISKYGIYSNIMFMGESKVVHIDCTYGRTEGNWMTVETVEEFRARREFLRKANQTRNDFFRSEAQTVLKRAGL